MVRALHRTTIEITTEDTLTERGDCIIGVGAGKGCAQLGEAVKSAIVQASSLVLLRVVVGDDSFLVRARGDPRLSLTDPHDIVVRKSYYASGRTIAVGSDSAAVDIPRRMVAMLRNPSSTGYLEVEVL
jgi:hypothetical protein